MRRTAEPLLDSYFALSQSLLSSCRGIGVLDSDFDECGSRGKIDARGLASWVRKEVSGGGRRSIDLIRRSADGGLEVALGLADSTGKLIAVIAVALGGTRLESLGPEPTRTVRQRLKPALDCLHRELAAAARARTKVATLSEKTRDLEWLFDVAARIKSAGSNQSALEQLLATSTERMKSAFCALIVPAQRLLIEHARGTPESRARFAGIRAKVQPQLLAWAQRHRRPLLMNRAGTASSRIAPCKLLCLPIASAKAAGSLGVLVFMNPSTAPDYLRRQSFLAAHVMRQAAQLLQSQYDLATGLLTRSALEETCRSPDITAWTGPVSVLLVDIDRLHVINNVHGFGVGDDLVVRVAQLLCAPVIPRDALVARVAGDQFAVVLPSCDVHAAADIATQLQKSVQHVKCAGVAQDIEVTLSCGIADFEPGYSQLTTALASAEAACDAAKERGRNRVETYACADQSIIRRHSDTFKAWSLEEALRNDQFVLFAQKIVPLRDPELPPGLEVLLRLRNSDQSIGTPADFLSAAQRYQMMPLIDRWVLDHTLELLEKHVGVLARQRVSISINVSADSLADDRFVDYLLERARNSRLPSRLITVEMTEQSAVRSMGRAVQLMKRLREAGCGVALDDFGTGTNSLVYLRDFPVTRVKVDGSFVRDILTNRRAESTLRGILELLKPYKVDTVAEYVENETVARKAGALGFDYGQGYAFGHPQPLEELIKGLRGDESRRLRSLSLEI